MVMNVDVVLVVVKVLDLVEEIFMVFGLRTHLATRSGKIIKNDRGGKEKGVIANACYHCVSLEHLAKTCCTPKHLVELYQKSIKNKGNRVEITLL